MARQPPSASYEYDEDRALTGPCRNCTFNENARYLDENNCLIYAIIQAQDDEKLEDSARNLEKLQQNLIYLAAIADSQPLLTITDQQQQHVPNILMQAVSQCLQPQLFQFYISNVTLPQALQLIQQQQTQQSLADSVPQPGSQIIHIQQAQQMDHEVLMLAQPVILHDQISKHQPARALVVQDQMPQPQFPHYALLHGSQIQLAQPVVMHDAAFPPQLALQESSKSMFPTFLYKLCPSQPQLFQFYIANVTLPQALPLIQQQQTQQSLADSVPQSGPQIIHMQQAQQMNNEVLMLAQPVILHDQISQHHPARALVVQDQMPQPQFPHYKLLHGPRTQLAQPEVMHDAAFQPQLAPQESLGRQLMLHDQVYQPQLQQAPLGNHGMLSSGGAIPNVGSNSVAGNASLGYGAVNLPLYLPNSGQEGSWGFGCG